MRGRAARPCKAPEQVFPMGVLVLAGGAGRRMGRDKAALLLGGKAFLDVIAEEFRDCPERLLSVSRRAPRDCRGFAPVFDRYPGCGPIGGIHAGLQDCRFAYLLTVGCDMPFYPADLACYLFSFLKAGDDALVPVDRSGRSHPLGGIYAKSAAGVLEQQIEAGDYRLRSALARLSVRYVPLEGSEFPDRALSNINTPEDYAALCGE